MSSPALTRSSDSATPALFPSDDLETRTALRGVIGHQHHAEVWPLPVGIGELRGHRAPQELIGVPAILHFDGNKPVERCVALLATCVLLPPGQEVGQIGVGATLHEAGQLRLSSDTRHQIPSPTQNRLHEPLPDLPLQEADVGAELLRYPCRHASMALRTTVKLTTIHISHRRQGLAARVPE